MEPIILIYIGAMSILGLFATNVLCKNFADNYADNSEKKIIRNNIRKNTFKHYYSH
jgi:hypothetical protein